MLRLAVVLLLAGGWWACATANERPVAPASPQNSFPPGAPSGNSVPSGKSERINTLVLRREAATTLLPFVHDADAVVRQQAAEALAQLVRHDALAPLLQLLQDSDATVRAAAAVGLGQADIGLDTSAAANEVRVHIEQVLLARLAIESADVVTSAIVQALGDVGQAAGFLELVRRAGTGEARAWWALGTFGARRTAEAEQREALHQLLALPAATAHADAAAFVVLRHRLDVTPDVVRALFGTASRVGQTFLLRRLQKTPEAAPVDVVSQALASADWLLVVEALRVAGVAHQAQAHAAVQSAVGTIGTGGAAHIVRAGCSAFARWQNDVGDRQLREVLAQLRTTFAQHPATVCDCELALAVRRRDPSLLAQCGQQDSNDERATLLRLAYFQAATLTASERVRAVVRNFDDVRARVRMAAGEALLAHATDTDLATVAAALQQEAERTFPDVGVVATLLAAFVDHPQRLSTETAMLLAKKLPRTADAVEAWMLLIDAAAHSNTSDVLAVALAKMADPLLTARHHGKAAWWREPGTATRIATSADVMPRGVLLTTTRGTFHVVFDSSVPSTVAHFVALARRGVYRHTPFHRVVSGFVAQGGDPRGDGFGGAGFLQPFEVGDGVFAPFAVGMASAGFDTAGSQFFVTYGREAHLDRRYTCFGVVDQGQDVVEAIEPNDEIVDVILDDVGGAHAN